MTLRVIAGGRDDVAERGLLIHGAAEIATVAASPTSGIGQGETATLHAGGAVAEAPVVAAWDGLIVAVGARNDVAAELATRGLRVERFQQVDATGGCVTPGLVDPHTHLLFAGTREDELRLRQQGAGYLEVLAAGGGILSTVAATRRASTDELLDHGRRWLREMLSHGVTTIEAKSGYGLDASTELRLLETYGRLAEEGPIDILPTFLGAHAVPADYRGRADATEAFVQEVVDVQLPAVAAQGIARFCDVFCEDGVFSADQARRILDGAMSRGMGARLHADELAPSGGAELAAELGAASADHLAAISDAGVDALARSAAGGRAVIATLLPATTWFLMSDHYAPARALIDRGVPVALGTDFNPGTSPTSSLPLVMTIACLSLGLSPDEALTAVTINAARAVGRSDDIGSLEVGKLADLVVWRTSRVAQIPYWPGADLVRTVVKRGRVVYSGA
jgi:imidazolonepropionase